MRSIGYLKASPCGRAGPVANAVLKSSRNEVEDKRLLESGETTVMKKRGLQGHVPNRRGAKLIAVVRVAGYLLQSEVFILPRPIEGHITSRRIACRRRDLRHADHVLSE